MHQELCDISSVLLYKLSCAFYAGSVNSSRFSTIMEQNKLQGITTVLLTNECILLILLVSKVIFALLFYKV